MSDAPGLRIILLLMAATAILILTAQRYFQAGTRAADRRVLGWPRARPASLPHR